MISLFIDAKTTDNPQIIEQAKLFLFVSTASLIPDPIRNIFSGTLRAYNDTAFAMFTALFSVVAVGTLSSALLGFRSSLSSLGIMLDRAVAFTVGVWIMTSYWHRKSHIIIDQTSLNIEQSKSLYNNISSWLSDCYHLFARENQCRRAENSQILAKEEQPLIRNESINDCDLPSPIFVHTRRYVIA